MRISPKKDWPLGHDEREVARVRSHGRAGPDGQGGDIQGQSSVDGRVEVVGTMALTIKPFNCATHVKTVTKCQGKCYICTHRPSRKPSFRISHPSSISPAPRCLQHSSLSGPGTLTRNADSRAPPALGPALAQHEPQNARPPVSQALQPLQTMHSAAHALPGTFHSGGLSVQPWAHLLRGPATWKSKRRSLTQKAALSSHARRPRQGPPT